MVPGAAGLRTTPRPNCCSSMGTPRGPPQYVVGLEPGQIPYKRSTHKRIVNAIRPGRHARQVPDDTIQMPGTRPPQTPRRRAPAWALWSMRGLPAPAPPTQAPRPEHRPPRGPPTARELMSAFCVLPENPTAPAATSTATACTSSPPTSPARELLSSPHLHRGDASSAPTVSSRSAEPVLLEDLLTCS